MALGRHTLLAGLILVAPLASGSGFDFTALQSLITAGHIHSIEDLLPALPGSLRYHYALVFASRSLQDASDDSPRVILYGSDARLIVTFNGNPSQRGFNVLETMEFDDDTGQFRLREIEFPARSSDSAAVRISEPNPSRCQRCHGAPARPVWETLPLWPGAYGERYHKSLSTEEQSGLGRFLARQPTDPRYRSLLAAQRFADPETFRPSTQSSYAGTPPEPPNAALSTLLEPLVSQSIAVELGLNPRFEAYQYLLLGVADGGCGGLDEFFPTAQWRAVRTAYSNYANATELESKSEAAAKQRRLTPGNQRYAAPSGRHLAAALSMIRFVAETELDMSTRTWTLSLEKGDYGYTPAPSALGSLRNALLAEVARRDARVKPLSEYATSADGNRYCRYLQRNSQAALAHEPLRAGLGRAVATPAPTALAGHSEPPAEETASVAVGRHDLSPPRTLNICVGCHESSVAPNIPFADAEQLKRELVSRVTSHGLLIDEIRFRLGPEAGSKRMPLNVNLADAERVELESYFLHLAAQPQ